MGDTSNAYVAKFVRPHKNIPNEFQVWTRGAKRADFERNWKLYDHVSDINRYLPTTHPTINNSPVFAKLLEDKRSTKYGSVGKEAFEWDPWERKVRDLTKKEDNDKCKA